MLLPARFGSFSAPGRIRKLDTLRGQATPEVASLADYPRLDPKRVLRIYRIENLLDRGLASEAGKWRD